MLEKKNVFKLPPPETILVETAVINKNLKKKTVVSKKYCV